MPSTNSISNETRNFVHQLAEGVNSAQAGYEIWFTLVGKDKASKEYSKEMEDYLYRDFFEAIVSGQYRLMFIEIACLFDSDNRAYSFWRLKELLDKEARNDIIDLIDYKLSPYRKLIKNITGIRNKSIAHHDRTWDEKRLYKEYAITPNDVRSLLNTCNELMKSIYSKLIYSGGSYPVARLGRFEDATYALLATIRNGWS